MGRQFLKRYMRLSIAFFTDQPMSTEQIKELIDWTEQLWESNPELMEMAGQDGYDLIMESLKEQLSE